MKKSSVFVWLVSAMAAASFALGCTATVTAGERDDDDNSSSSSSSSGSSGASSSGSSGNTSSSGGTSSSSGSTSSFELGAATATPNRVVVGEKTEVAITFSYSSAAGLPEEVEIGLGAGGPQGVTEPQLSAAIADVSIVVDGDANEGNMTATLQFTAPVAGEYQFQFSAKDSSGAEADSGIATVTAAGGL